MVIEQSEDEPGDVEVEARLRHDLLMRPAPAFAPDLRAVKRRGLRRRRRAQLLPAFLVLLVVGAGASTVGAGVLPGAQRKGTVTAVPAGDVEGAVPVPAWCQGGSITYDYDGTGLASPELALQYLVDLSTLEADHLGEQPASAEVDGARTRGAVVLGALDALEDEATVMGTDRVRQDGAVVARNGNGEVVAKAVLDEVQPGRWNVTTLSFAAPDVPECGR